MSELSRRVFLGTAGLAAGAAGLGAGAEAAAENEVTNLPKKRVFIASKDGPDA